MTSDLATSRALAERTRENTADGLAAREALVDVVEHLVAEIEAIRDLNEPPGEQWATRLRWPSDGTEEITGPVDEWLARKRLSELPKMHTALLRRTVTYGPWVEEPNEWVEAGNE